MTSSGLSKHNLETLLIEKCWKDPAFKKQVLADPKSMFEEFLGQKLPGDFQVVIHEDDKNTLHFAIPPAPARAAELSDEELEKVAGGTEIIIVTPIVTVATAGAAIVGTIASVVKGTTSGW